MKPTVYQKRYRQFLDELPTLINKYIRFVSGKADESIIDCDPLILRALQAKQNLSEGALENHGLEPLVSVFFKHPLVDRDFQAADEVEEALDEVGYDRHTLEDSTMLIQSSFDTAEGGPTPWLELVEEEYVKDDESHAKSYVEMEAGYISELLEFKENLYIRLFPLDKK